MSKKQSVNRRQNFIIGREEIPFPDFDFDFPLGTEQHHITEAEFGDMTEGTLLMKVTDPAMQLGDGSNRFYFNIGDNWVDDSIASYKYKTTGRLYTPVRTGGAQDSGQFLNTLALPNHHVNIAVTWNADFVLFCINGFVWMYDIDYVKPTSWIDGIRINGRSFGDFPLPATITIRDAKVWKTPLSIDQTLEITRIEELKSGITRDRTIGVIGFLGQSNMVGKGLLAGAPDYVTDIKNIKNDGDIDIYSDPFEDPTNSLLPYADDGAPLMSLAGTVVDNVMKQTGKTMASLPCGLAGTTMQFLWTLNREIVTDRFMSGPCSQSAIQQLTLAKQHGSLKYLVYFQGESDARNAYDPILYKAQLENLFASLIKQYNAPIICVSLHTWHTGTGATEQAWNDIQEAQNSIDMHRVTVVPALGKEATVGDELHLTSAGLISLGEDIAQAILENGWEYYDDI